MSLTFNPRNHSYRLDGRAVPGVTTLLSKGLPKPALPYWAAKSVAEFVIENPEGVEQLRAMGRGPAIAALKGVPWERRDTAAVRGTAVHALAEQVIHGQTVEVPDHLHAHVDGYVRWLDTFSVEPVLTERTVASRRWFYAGTFDLIADIDGVRWGLDLKTSSAIYGETALQVAAYMTAEFYVDGDDERPIPVVERIGGVHVTETGTALYPLLNDPPEIEKAAAIFRHIAHVAKHTDWIKERVGAPIEEPTHV